MTRVVVTGGCGVTGNHLVEKLIARGDEVTVLDARPPSPVTREQAAYVAGDVLDQRALTEVILPDTELVIHLVDQPNVLYVSLTGTHNVLDRATETGARVVVACRPIEAMTEQLTYTVARQRGLAATVVRYADGYVAKTVAAILRAATEAAAEAA